VSVPARAEHPARLALAELESVIRNVTDQLATFRRRALAAEARSREAEEALRAAQGAGEAESARLSGALATSVARIAELERAVAATAALTARVAELEKVQATSGAQATRIAELEQALADATSAQLAHAEATATELAPPAPVPPRRDAQGQLVDPALLAENEALRARLAEATERTRVIAERVRFLRQQLSNGGER
jgi:chromosome segregation ATPase